MSVESAALAALDADALVRDLCDLVALPSLTGRERPVMEAFAARARALGLATELVEHDLEAVRALPGYPGEEAPRDELVGVTVTLPGRGPGAPRLCLDGHLDVVDVGTAAWQHDPWGGLVEDGSVYGRGSVDMKGGVVAALHATAAVARAGGAPCEVVLHAVASEEDGGLGTFAALERDDRFDACLIPEPTAFAIVCAQAGALTFEGLVRGRSAHAATRLQGVSAIDRYIALHAALHEHERRINAGVRHPLMRELELPYPLLVGRIEAGAWSSQVPDLLRFEGRVGVRIGETIAGAKAGFEAAVAAATDDRGPAVELTWNGGQFGSCETAVDHPFVGLVQEAVGAELGREPALAGVPYGADMRLFSAREIPAVMVGTSGGELAHAVDERVAIDEVVALARSIVRVICRFE